MYDLFSYVKNCAFLFICLVIFIPLSIYISSEALSKLGTYHSLDLKGSKWKKMNMESTGVEDFPTKYYKVLQVNLALSAIIMVNSSIIISDALREQLDNFELNCFSLILTLVSLITIRLLSNQSELFAPGSRKINSIKLKEDYAEKRNEKVIGHFHTLICTSLMILIIQSSVSVLFSNNTSDLTNKTEVLDNQKILSKEQFVDIKPAYNSYAVCIYCLFLPIITFLVELILVKYKPIVQDDNYSGKSVIVYFRKVSNIIIKVPNVIRSKNNKITTVGILSLMVILILFSLLLAGAMYSGILEYY